MIIRIANAPVSWGVFVSDDDRNPPWQHVLDQISSAGYEWLELGPLGYIPEDEARRAVAASGLAVAGTFLYEPLSLCAGDVDEQARRTCSTLRSVGGRYLVVIDAMNSARMATAGRSASAERLSTSRFDVLMTNIARVTEIAQQAGLRAVFHPHVGSYVEFDDEIERFVSASEKYQVGLCIDTGHIAYAGLDPLAVYDQYANRVEYFHFKDVDPAVRLRVLTNRLGWDHAVAEGIFCSLGDGCVDFIGLREAMMARGFDGWATVEQDTVPGEYGSALAGTGELGVLETRRVPCS